ncbi:MAG: hypothetical protein WBN75_03985 [Verrucomicrobiia bacterium]
MDCNRADLVEELGSKYGSFAAASLSQFGSDAVPAIITATQSTNPAVRSSAARIFNGGNRGYYGIIRDPRLTEAALAWLKDSEPSVRIAGVETLTDYSNWNPVYTERLVAMLHDEDAGVRHAVASLLPSDVPRFRRDIEKYIPVFKEMLKDKDPGVRAAGLEILQRLQVEIPREDFPAASSSSVGSPAK